MTSRRARFVIPVAARALPPVLKILPKGAPMHCQTRYMHAGRLAHARRMRFTSFPSLFSRGARPSPVPGPEKKGRDTATAASPR